MSKSNSDKVSAEIKVAYADCHMDFEKGINIRNLHFRSAVGLTPKQASKVMNRWVKGYNNFYPKLLELLPDDSTVFLAREGSVCAYVRPGETPIRVTEGFRRELEADELDNWNDGTVRIWWD